MIWYDVERVPQNAHHYWTLFVKSISRLLWYIFLFLTEHNPSFTLFLIYSFTQSELRCSYKVCSYKKKCSKTFCVNLIRRFWRPFQISKRFLKKGRSRHQKSKLFIYKYMCGSSWWFIFTKINWFLFIFFYDLLFTGTTLNGCIRDFFCYN